MSDHEIGIRNEERLDVLDDFMDLILSGAEPEVHRRFVGLAIERLTRLATEYGPNLFTIENLKNLKGLTEGVTRPPMLRVARTYVCDEGHEYFHVVEFGEEKVERKDFTCPICNGDATYASEWKFLYPNGELEEIWGTPRPRKRLEDYKRGLIGLLRQWKENDHIEIPPEELATRIIEKLSGRSDEFGA